jgi:hypothetical protein
MTETTMPFDDDEYDRRADLRAEYAEELAEERGNVGRYNCGGWSSYDGPCGATDCCNCYPGGVEEEPESDEDEELFVQTVKIVTVRKARPAFYGKSEIRIGDRAQVTSGFTYEQNGPRTGYFRSYTLITKGPAWDVNPADTPVIVSDDDDDIPW